MEVIAAAENAFIVYPSSPANRAINDEDAGWVIAADRKLRQALAPALIDTVPSYGSLLVIFDPWHADPEQVRATIVATLENQTHLRQQPGKLVKLPVYYDPEVGPDLVLIAERAGVSIDRVIQTHHQKRYRVYAMGFAPGFGFLGTVAPLIAAPRKATPRAVTKGSVAIAESQTAVYPSDSPGGWNVIGRCPIPLFSLEQHPPTPLTVGDEVAFEPISREDFLTLGGKL